MSRYDAAHRQLRSALLPFAAGSPCARCGKPITAGEAVDLDHAEDGGYLGWSHPSCNRRAGAVKGARMRSKKQIPFEARCAVGVDIAHDREHTSVVLAAEVEGGTAIELEYIPGSDVAHIVARLALSRPNLAAVAIDPRSPATTLIAPLTQLGVRVTEPGTRDVALAHGLFLDELKAARIRAIEHDALSAAVQHAVARPLAGGEALERRRVDVDASPMTAAELAVWGLLRAESQYAGGGFFDLDDYVGNTDESNGVRTPGGMVVDW